MSAWNSRVVTTGGRAAAAWLLTAVMTGASIHAQPPEVRGLSVAYADGRVVTNVLRAKGGFWTPFFPRIAPRPIAPGGLAKYLDVQYVREGDELVATVSLATDKFQDRVTVAVVRVAAGTAVSVEELTRYGVAPITLSIVSIGPVQAYAPVIEEPSGQLVVRAEPAQPDAPMYRVTVFNQSGRALRAFDYEGYQGDLRLFTGRQKHQRNEPLVLPGAEYSFEMPLSGVQGQPWRTLDRLVLTSVVWDDGTVDGNPEPAARERELARTRGLHLKRLLQALKSSDATRLVELQRMFERLDRSDYALENARTEALAEIETLRRAPPRVVERWLAAKLDEYTAWQRRCERAARQD